MKIIHGVYNEINTLDELINALTQLKEKHGGETNIKGSSIINMGMGDNGFDEFETNSKLDVCTYYDDFDNTINLYVVGKCDLLQEQQKKTPFEIFVFFSSFYRHLVQANLNRVALFSFIYLPK